MDKFLKINEVSHKYNISKRTLRYYEEVGILGSIQRDDSNYRYYNTATLNRLEQILLLKNLKFSINEIYQILLSNNSKIIKEVFHAKLNKIQADINALVSLKKIISSIITINDEKGTSSITINELLKEQLYINNKIERMMKLEQYDNDILFVEFGADIIPCADDLIKSIVNLREKIENSFKKKMPLVRIRDNDKLSQNQFRLLIKGVIVENEDLTNFNDNDKINKMIGSLEKAILSNLDRVLS